MLLRFPAKDIRAKVIAEYVRKADYRGCICFSSGNASRALKETGIHVVDISPSGDLQAEQWWPPNEIRKVWPELFDATSGHLPAFLMVQIGMAFRKHLGKLSEKEYNVPTGSGETIQCLRWVYPDITFRPIFFCGPGTEWHNDAPLLPAVCPEQFVEKTHTNEIIYHKSN